MLSIRDSGRSSIHSQSQAYKKSFGEKVSTWLGYTTTTYFGIPNSIPVVMLNMLEKKEKMEVKWKKS